MGRRRNDTETGFRMLCGVILIALSFFVGLSLFSYDWHDISKLQVSPNDPPCNLIGPLGAWMAFGAFMTFGVGAYLIPVWLLVVGILLSIDKEPRVWPRVTWSVVLLLSAIVLLQLRPERWTERCLELNMPYYSTGIFGEIFTEGVVVRGINRVGAAMVFGVLALVSFVMLVRTHTLLRGYELAGGGWQGVKERLDNFLEKRREAREKREQEDLERRALEERREMEAELLAEETARAEEAVADEPDAGDEGTEDEKPRKKRKSRKKKTDDDYVDPDVPLRGSGSYKLPPVTLLNAPAKVGGPSGTADIEFTSRVLVETLSDFKIDAEVVNVDRGPVVTRYELLPAPGVKVERIANLSNNLALSLKATSVRVQAPIPGKGVVGVEVPNSAATLVVMREIMEGKAWRPNKYQLPLVLGKDVSGADVIADLARMPHLLIAGATGTGKSVCMNSMLAGLLMSRTPDQLRLMLVDPKIVEFAPYNNLPHLVVPVITDPKKVALGLRWAIREMEKRYKLFSRAGVRNIDSFNNRPKVKQETLFGEEEEENDTLPERVPHIVIVIDELADLMLVDQAEIENCVARLAQLSRAVGIHMVIATQRPSVNVITGTIKANFPARIAFKVAQKVDSRTILDGMGAETLLGRGDMLFMPPGSIKLVRAQGSMITDDEIKRVVGFIKEQVEPSYEMEIKSTLDKTVASAQIEEGGGEDEELIEKVVEIIRETHRASTSSMQRRLRIGYTRAARIMDVLEERGVVGPPRGSEPREILIDLDGDITNTSRDEEGPEDGDGDPEETEE